MYIEIDQMMSITSLQKALTRTVREVAQTGKSVYILKNSSMEAVLLPYTEYAYLKNLEEVVEQLEIKNMLKERLKKYNPKNNISWEKVREKI
ncbi:antitoxin Phd-YefM [Candidatus Termititenax persephonae]|uniref:Antitoxin Phd-YefM n=1 Tax=Candidatus Termititenax persephonae TaxID=2218525 RepID=A0A388TFS6_9BACT|nr:antitoxin Phd-YefM [Candidatus Termititenax persephonae]